jgi:capsular exopolysaccharide synthesis family protein
MIAPAGDILRTARANTRGRMLLPQRVIWRNRWLFLAIVVSAILDAAPFAFLVKSLYTSSAQLLVQPPAEKRDLARALAPLDMQRFAQTERGVIDSSAVLNLAAQRPELRDLRTFAGAPDIGAYLADELRVQASPRDDTIRVEIDSAYQNEPARIVAVVIDSYISFRSTAQHEADAESLKHLLEERQKCAEEMAAKREALLAVENKAGIVSFDDRNPPAVQSLRQITEALSTARAEELKASAENRAVLADYPEDAAHQRLLAEARKNPLLSLMSGDDFAKAKVSRDALESELAKARRTELPANAHLQSLQNDYEHARALSLAASERQWDRAKRSVADIAAAHDQQAAVVGEYLKNVQEHSVLTADLQGLQSRLDVLNSNLWQDNSARSSGPSITVLQEPFTPLESSSPHRLAIMGWGILAGLVVATVVAYCREILHPRMHDALDVEEVLGLEVLADLPAITTDERHADFSHPLEAVADECRKIAMQIRRAHADDPVRTLLIASQSCGDGRSTLAKNLAIVLANSGRRVLLVDADMRQPAQHRNFSEENRRGLSSVLLGKESVERAVTKTMVRQLDLLAAGPAHRNPEELLNFHDLSPVLKEISRDYDQVIIDSPPAGAFADAKLLANVCDATILVVRAGRSEQQQARAGCEEFRKVDARVIGVVMNRRPLATALAKRMATSTRWMGRWRFGQAMIEDDVLPAGASDSEL